MTRSALFAGRPDGILCSEETILIARITLLAVLIGTLGSHLAAAQPRAETLAAFENYVAQAETRIRREQSSPESFLSTQLVAASPGEFEDRLRRGEVLVAKRGNSPVQVPGGLIHHWLGVVFIPDATIGQLLGVLQDYDHLVRYYRPEVMASRLISRNGDQFQISMRLRKHKVVTVVLDTEYDVHYGRLDAAHQYSLSRSTRVTEIANPGQSDEHPVAGGNDHGFMWRLNTYWRFVQAADGVVVECEAISLTRNVPAGLGWLIGPFIQNIPRESLEFTLTSTRNALAAKR